MMNRGAAMLAMVALLAGGWAPKPPVPRVITNPDWLERPSGDDVARLYPELASRLEIEGRATLSCTISALGDLQGCSLSAEEPAELGFGGATLAMAPLFRMRPMTIDGEPVAGGTVRIPIRFMLPKAAPPAIAAARPKTAGEKPTDEALRLAGQVVDGFGFAETAVGRHEKRVREIEFLGVRNTSEATRFAAADALRAATEAHAKDYREAFARAVAATFSESEMAQIVSYLESPARRAIRDTETFQAVAREISREYERRTRAEANTIYCKSHECDGRNEALRVWRAGDPADGVIDDPQWADQPEAADLVRALPRLAVRLGLTGVARLRCRVRIDGRLESCAALDEAPAGFGYGNAGVSLAGKYRVTAQMLSQGAAGEAVIVQVAFPPSEALERFEPLPGRSDRAVALGRQVVALSNAAASGRRNIDTQADRYMSSAPSGVAARAYGDGVTAFRAGAEQALAAYLENLANAWGALHAEAELTALVAFRSSPNAALLDTRAGALNAALTAADYEVGERITGEARESFCRTRACGPRPP